MQCNNNRPGLRIAVWSQVKVRGRSFVFPSFVAACIFGLLWPRRISCSTGVVFFSGNRLLWSRHRRLKVKRSYVERRPPLLAIPDARSPQKTSTLASRAVRKDHSLKQPRVIIVIIITINSWFCAPPTARTMTHYTDQFNSAIPTAVGSLEQERFQGTLENWRRAHQLEFCWQPVPCSGGGNRKRPLAEFQTRARNDVVAVWRAVKSRSWWDISHCSQHASQVGWRLANKESLCTTYCRPVVWSAASATPGVL